jgi:hypothetical protein
MRAPTSRRRRSTLPARRARETWRRESSASTRKYDGGAGGARLITIELHGSPNSSLNAGDVFAVDLPTGSGGPPGRASITLTDVYGSTIFATWQSTAGRVTVTSVDGDGVAAHFDAAMSPVQDTSSDGSFRLAGDVSVDKVADTHFLSGSP